MIIWVNPTAVGMPVPQRAEVISTDGQRINIKLLGMNEDRVIHANHVIGLEVNNRLTILFKVIQIRS
jgi:predicted thioesterase